METKRILAQWEEIANHVLNTAQDTGPASPHVTDGASWELLPLFEAAGWTEEGWHHGNWTGGFWPGILWVISRQVPDPAIRPLAEKASARLFARMDDRTSHDVGFMFHAGIVEAWRGTRESIYRTVALHVASLLASRMQPGGYLAAWGPLEDPRSAETSTIDTMMNLPLLWWAYRLTRQRRWYEAADRHATTSIGVYLREDGSTYHRAELDPATGIVRTRGTFQGAGPDSCWSRGQAWAIAGFVEAFLNTGNARYEVAASRAFRYYREQLHDGNPVPLWDFAAPPSDPRDSSAAAIVAFAAIKMGLADGAQEWMDFGLTTLSALRTRYRRAEAVAGLLDHAAYSVPHRWGVDEAAIWGDYYFVKALELTTGML